MSQMMARVWPNGEFAIFSVKMADMDAAYVDPDGEQDGSSLGHCLIRAYGVVEARKRLKSLGLSKVSISDTGTSASVPVARKGLKGLSSRGRRMVRNSVFLLERDSPRHSVVLATVTIPSTLTDHQKGLVCERWADVVESYRRDMRRELNRAGLSGEIIGVSEIQPGRSGVELWAALHLHCVFCGRRPGKAWAVSTERHDLIWRRAIQKAIGVMPDICPVACQVVVVKRSASAYLSKYISKGVKEIELLVSLGLSAQIPKAWYFQTRAMLNSVLYETRYGELYCSILLQIKSISIVGISYWKDIFVDQADETSAWLATAGALSSVGRKFFRDMVQSVN
jgi:hypothetical protein